MMDSNMSEQKPDNARRASESRRLMSNASLIFGILAIATVMCVYTPLIFGGISITLALLSRGSAPHCTRQGKTGILLSVVAILILAAMVAFTVHMILTTYGSFEAFYNDYMEKYNYTMQQLLGNYQQ